MESWLGRLGLPARMGLALTLMAAGAGSIGALAGGEAIAQSKKPTPVPVPGALECVAVVTEAAFASVGYDHLVHVTNGCKRRVGCTVTTNVNPDPARVELSPGESRTLVTWRGSPAREFTAEAKCLEK
jgi:hypothetical protein